MQSVLRNPKHLAERRQLRRHQTKAEQVLWQELRNQRMKNKFRRQVSVGPYIVDFYCHALRLAIELDGPIHGEQQEYDKSRQTFIEKQGIRVVRYRNDQVLFERESVLQDIMRIADELAFTSPQPSPKREGDNDTPSPSGEGKGEVGEGQRVRSINILYEDNHLIAVYKPAGLLVQGDHSGDPTLMDEVKYFIKQRDNKPGNVFLGMVHRLDRPVSGIVLFAKTSKGAARISEQFRNHTIEKVYHAIVIGVPKERKARLEHYIKKEEDINKVKVYDSAVPDAQKAILSYEVVETKNDRSLLRIQLETGRPHQIRAQLSTIGHPIVGDVKYGAPLPLPDKSLALCATSLTFLTATTDERKAIEIEVPSFPQI